MFSKQAKKIIKISSSWAIILPREYLVENNIDWNKKYYIELKEEKRDENPPLQTGTSPS